MFTMWCLDRFISYLFIFVSIRYIIYTFSVIRLVSIVNCKLTKLHSCFYLFIPGRLLSFSFVVLGSSCCGSSLNQWLAHLISLTELLVMYIYAVCGLDQAPFFISVNPLSMSMSLPSGSGTAAFVEGYGSASRHFMGAVLRIGLAVRGMSYAPSLSWLLWGLLLGVRYQSSGL